MHRFGTAEVSRLTDIPPASVRAMVRARYVSPSRGPRGSLRFSFQDLVLLRTARALVAARVPRRRVGDALRALREKLPDELPASGLSITAAGGRVVVHEGGEQREVLSGQLLLSLRIEPEGKTVRLVEVSRPAAEADGGECERQFEAALALEDSDVAAAVEAYRACVDRHAHCGAAANLGRLLHLQGRISEAVALYRSVREPDADVLYNLAVALEDQGNADEAQQAYQRVLAMDEGYADAHHNLARLYQEAGDTRRALRHWSAYRRLSRASDSP